MGSKRDVPLLVRGAGLLTSIFSGLVAAVKKRGGSEEQIHQLATPEGEAMLAKIADLIVGKTAEAASAISVVWSAVLGWVIGACRFTYVNPNITAENFPPQPGDFTVKEVEVVNFGRNVSTEEARKLLDERGLRPATLMELLWWWLMHPEKHSDCLVVALGSLWTGHVPYVSGGGSLRRLFLGPVANDWDAFFSFAGVRKDDKA